MRKFTNAFWSKTASTKLKVILARYDWAEERIMVKEDSERLEVIPAQYETIEKTSSCVRRSPRKKKAVVRLRRSFI
jgi:hypothetical protein